MNKQEIKEIMAIARPAIYALYGRYGSLELVKYNIVTLDSIWIQVDRINYGNRDNYTLHIENGVITTLSERELNV